MLLKRLIFAVVLVSMVGSSFGLDARAAGTADTQPARMNATTEVHQVFLPLVTSHLPAIIPNSTNILTDASNQFLVSISADSTQFIFSHPTAELDDVEPGEIIVSDIAAAAPNGYLRAVLAKQLLNGQVILTTAPATLEDALQQGSVSYSYDISPADIVEASGLPGVTLTINEPNAPDIEVINLPLNEVMLGGSVVATGSLSLDMTLEFDFAIRHFSLESMHMYLRVTETASLQLVSTYETGGAEEYPIASYRVRPLTIMVGSFPIVVQPTIEVFLGVNGTVSAALSTGLTQTASLTGGVQYVDGGLSPIKGFNNNFAYQPPTLSAAMDVKAYAGAGLELDFYSASPLVPELGLEVRAGPRLQVDESLCWVLKGFLEVDLEAELSFIKWELAEVDTNLFSSEKLVLNADQCTLLEVRPESGESQLVTAAIADADNYNVPGGVFDYQEEIKVSPQGEAGDMSLLSEASADASGSVAHASSSASVVYDTATNSLGVPYITGATVTLDTAWNYNPNNLSSSSQYVRADGGYYIRIFTHVAGDLVFAISSNVNRSSDNGHSGGLFRYETETIQIPINGSLIITRSVGANEYHFFNFDAIGINWGEASFEHPASGGGIANTTLQWTFFPGGVP